MTDTLQQKVQKAIERLRAFEPPDGYYLAYSGGKDSDCIKILAQLAGVKFEAVYSLTTVDAPETVRYIQSQPDVQIRVNHYPDGKPVTMWNLIPRMMIPPTRRVRYCCERLKENGGSGRIVVTGVRWAESVRRREHADVVQLRGKPKTTRKLAEEMGAQYRVTKQGGIVLNDDNDANRRMVEHCYRTRKTMVNPIVDWTDDEVWEFLSYYGCESNPLYKCGESRIGCLGCPMATKRKRLAQFEKYPKYKEAYLRAFDRMLKARDADGRKTDLWTDAQSVMDWWLRD